jgi:hypothetical protein
VNISVTVLVFLSDDNTKYFGITKLWWLALQEIESRASFSFVFKRLIIIKKDLASSRRYVSYVIRDAARAIT